MQKMMFLSLLMYTVITTHAQQTDQTKQYGSDTIQIVKTFGGYRFYQHNEQLSLKKLQTELKSNAAAHQLSKSSNGPRLLGTVLGAAGGVLVGWPLGTAIGGGDPNWTLAAVGGGLIAASIPLNISAGNKLKKAIGVYNGDLQRTGVAPVQLQLKTGTNGMGLALSF